MIEKAFSRLLSDKRGATAVEFALIAPLLITMMLGVTQAGMWMQSYNAMRSVADDTGRYTTVKYQQGLRISNQEISDWANSHAIQAPYFLKTMSVATYVDDAATQSISGVTEKTLKITYQMPTVLDFAGVKSFKMSYSRPLFVKTGT